MGREAIPIISDLVWKYYSADEFQALAEVFDVNICADLVRAGNWLPVIKELVVNISHNNHRAFLKALLDSLIRQAEQGIGNTQWEAREAHQNALADLKIAEKILSKDALPDEISVDESRHFSAKSEARQFLSLAETEILIVDPYLGLGTLDCLVDVQVDVRILTGVRPEQLEKGLDRHIKEFCAEGRKVTIKQHPKLHDRYIFFNDRCWLLGSSLKDAGKKRFNCIEVTDGKLALKSDIDKKWDESEILDDSNFPIRKASL